MDAIGQRAGGTARQWLAGFRIDIQAEPDPRALQQSAPEAAPHSPRVNRHDDPAAAGKHYGMTVIRLIKSIHHAPTEAAIHREEYPGSLRFHVRNPARENVLRISRIDDQSADAPRQAGVIREGQRM